MIRSGLLNNVISIEKPIKGDKAFGGTYIDYEQYIPKTRARVIYQNGNRIDDNNEIFNAYNISFIIRYYHDVTEEMIVIWDDSRYRILSIEKDRHNNQKILNCELINE